MENNYNARKPLIQIVEISRVIPKPIKKASDTYKRNKFTPHFNSRNSGLDYRA